MKVLERFRIKTADGGEYTLITTGASSHYVGFITGDGPTTGCLDSERCMWAQPPIKGQPLTLQLKVDSSTWMMNDLSTWANPVLIIPAVVQVKKRRLLKSWPRWVWSDPTQ